MKKIMLGMLTILLSFFLVGCTVTTTTAKSSTTTTKSSVNVVESQLENQICNVIENLEKATFCVLEYTDTESENYTAMGSGVIYKKISNDNGTYTYYLVTNKHVVENGKKFKIYTSDNSTITADLLGVSEDFDIAVLNFTAAAEYNAVTFANKDDIKRGQYAIAMGTPLSTEYFNTATVGNVSGVRDLYIQHNAPINSGNSGGPLVDLSGELLGINTMKLTTSGSGVAVEGMYFSIRCDHVQEAINTIEANNIATSRPIIGITVMDVAGLLRYKAATFDDYYNGILDQFATLYSTTYNVTKDEALIYANAYYGDQKISMKQQYDEHNPLAKNLPSDVVEGIYVKEVSEGLAADKMGILVGDIIIEIMDVEVGTGEEFMKELYKHKTGDTISIVVNRNGVEIKVEGKI